MMRRNDSTCVSTFRIFRATAIYAWVGAVIGFTSANAGDMGTEAQRQAGKQLYNSKCSQCHGETGDGKGDGAEYFRPTPRIFTSGTFKIRTTESGELPTDADLRTVIKRGMPYTGMPAWPKFSDQDLMNLVYYIKTFNSDFADSTNKPKSIELPKAPAMTQESITRGKQLFAENKCLDCHGKLGRGDGESGPTLKDDWKNPIRPADLTKRWTYRGGSTREDIYRTFMTGLSGTPMPSYASSVAEKDRWPLVDYVYSLSPGDQPGYATMVLAEFSPTPLDISKGKALFATAKPAVFPVVGQVVEDKRNFFPGVNAVEARSMYDAENVAVLLTWHDMSAQKTGSNTPVTVIRPVGDTTHPIYSDAIALQIPAKNPDGVGKPYFLFGDKRNAVDLWFADLVKGQPQLFVGKGSGNVSPAEGAVSMRSGYQDGEWWVVFSRKRQDGKHMPFDEGTFVPVAFSVWDGFNAETGGNRGVTSWYSIYLKPSHTESPIVPAGKQAAACILIEAGVIWIMRRRVHGQAKVSPAEKAKI